KDKGTYPKFNANDVISTKFFTCNTSEKTANLVMQYGLRNSQLLTIAPTGTLSTMIGVSGGIEPIFANYYTRKTESLHDKDVYYKVYTPIVKAYMQENNLIDDKYLPDWFVTSQDIKYEDRIKMQSVWQKHIDASISSTVNLPEHTTVSDVENLYIAAWENGLKGITVFRNGCSRGGILSTEKNNKNKAENTENKLNINSILKRGDIIQVNDDVIGKKRKLTTGCGSLHCSAFFDPTTGDLLETYLSKGSLGGCANYMVGLSRLISLSARSGSSVYSIADQLNSCGVCPSYAVRSATKKDTSKGSCCPMAVGNALIDMYKEIRDELGLDEDSDYKQNVIKRDETDNIKIEDFSTKAKCPSCGEPLINEGGCNICKSCGWSKCE
ncbi:MAG TPA: hypothetical protein K8V91_00940, partial [[Clostridium] spiroforme]|nr:hypothetical protein [Thomasclavelia spiroformis]